MPLKKVIREKHAIEERVVGAICNVCGKVGEVDGSMGWPHGFHVWDLEGGWGDHFPGDLERFQIVACEDCLRAWVGTFKLPDVFVLHRVSGPVTTFKAKHSETEEVLNIDEGWAFPEGMTRPDEELPDYEGEYPAENTIWEHFKGQRYYTLGFAFDVRTQEPLVVYQALYGDSDIWARPLPMWSDIIRRPEYEGPRFTAVSRRS